MTHACSIALPVALTALFATIVWNALIITVLGLANALDWYVLGYPYILLFHHGGMFWHINCIDFSI